MDKSKQIKYLYREAETCLLSLSIIDEERTDYERVSEILIEMRDLASQPIQINTQDKPSMQNEDRPAFPTNGRMHSEMVGLTKREYFAAMAMQGILSGRNEQVEQRGYPYHEVAVWAAEQADELIKQLEK